MNYLVLLENGIPVGVARPDRTTAAEAWRAAKPGRAIVTVTEVR